MYIAISARVQPRNLLLGTPDTLGLCMWNCNLNPDSGTLPAVTLAHGHVTGFILWSFALKSAILCYVVITLKYVLIQCYSINQNYKMVYGVIVPIYVLLAIKLEFDILNMRLFSDCLTFQSASIYL